jgi:hypothetical protein
MESFSDFGKVKEAANKFIITNSPLLIVSHIFNEMALDDLQVGRPFS